MIDPTYLRIIFDGLDSHTLNKGNAPALPLGLIGIYEEALPPANQIVELDDDVASRWGPRVLELITAIRDAVVAANS